MDPPDWTDDERSGSFARHFVERMSEYVTPTTVDRAGMHSINVNSENRLSKQTSLSRRMSSLTPPIQGAARSLNEIWTDYRKELEFTIHKEKTKDHEVAAPDLLSQEGRLRKRLGKLNMDMNACQGDGNCLFRAISMELWKTQDYHGAVRRKAVRYMRENKEDFEGYLGEEFDAYTTSMAQLGTWGDELTLRAACDAYGIIVNVLTSDQHNWFMRYLPKMVKHAKEVFLTYIAPVHYNTIRRKAVLQTLRHSASLTRKSIIETALDKADEAQKEMESIPEAPTLQEKRTGAGTMESQPAETSAEIAKALGHPSAAGAILATLSEHPSSVSTSGTPHAETSSAGALAGCDISHAGPPELQATSVRTDDSQRLGSSRSQSTGLSHVSPFALPEAQHDPQVSLNGLQPAPISKVTPPGIHLQHRSPQHDQSPACGLGIAEDQHIPSVVAGAQVAQQAPLSSTANPQDSADRSGNGLQSDPQTAGNPFALGNSASTLAGAPKRSSARETGQCLAPDQATQIASSPGSVHQAPPALTRVGGSDNASMQHSRQQHSRPSGQQEVPSSPTVDDVLSGRSAATDRAALQELMGLKAPVPVS